MQDGVDDGMNAIDVDTEKAMRRREKDFMIVVFLEVEAEEGSVM